jgi:hypothetical protein
MYHPAIEPAASAASDALGYALRSAPPAVVGVLTAAGAQLPLVVQIITGVYVVLQIVVLVRDKFWRQRKKKE